MSVAEFVVRASPASSNFGIGCATKKGRRDVMMKLVDGISSITFSKRVHKFIERKMAHTIVEADNKVLTSGPWMILGQYLIIRTWSLTFSMIYTEVDTQVVWVQFPGISEGYYFEFLLNAIGQIIGPVLKIDENIDNAKKGRFARLSICLDL
ncbi:hypothetical protein CXB51_007869 [Gossypium anomalum]|uniref:DUF4283 domain-containing protein n=1 Tax=Gossypium anomalum TaxID=47600 RepID=A0A8J6D692_9ROSI|nr:hypothetical protein CXB51_007869 [Gossypium anomalum]